MMKNLHYLVIRTDANRYDMEVEEVARLQSLPKSELVDVREDIRSPKTCSNISMDRKLPDDDWHCLEMEASL